MSRIDKGTSSRRDLLYLGVAIGAMKLLGTPEVAYGAEHLNETINRSLNVRTFGAVGDTASDDTAAFQRTLDAAYKSGGGAVYAPPGQQLNAA